MVKIFLKPYLNTDGLVYPSPLTIVSLISELSHLMSGTKRWNKADAAHAGMLGYLSWVDSGDDAALDSIQKQVWSEYTWVASFLTGPNCGLTSQNVFLMAVTFAAQIPLPPLQQKIKVKIKQTTP